MNKKIILGLSVLLVALFALIGGASYAWLTSTGADDTNTYTVGEVSYTISATDGASTLVVPGQGLYGNVTIVNKSTVASNLRVTFAVSAKKGDQNLNWSIGTSATDDEILITGTNTEITNWVSQYDAKKGIYYFYYGAYDTDNTKTVDNIAAATDTVNGDDIPCIFSGIILNGALVGNDATGVKVTVTINFEAKQADHVTWAKLVNIEFSTGLAQ